MKRVPALFPCPSCGVHIQKVRGGPYGLAHHLCSELQANVKAEVQLEINRVLLADNLTIDDAQQVLLKLAVLRATEDGATSQEISGVLEKLGELRKSTGTAVPANGGGAGSILEQLARG